MSHVLVKFSNGDEQRFEPGAQVQEYIEGCQQPVVSLKDFQGTTLLRSKTLDAGEYEGVPKPQTGSTSPFLIYYCLSLAF
jgi:hypothetical protein